MDILESFNNQTGFINHNGIKITNIGSNVTAEVSLSDISNNPYGITHGGLIYALADTACGVHVFSKTNKKAVTLNSQIHYLKPGTGSKLIAKTEDVKIGKTVSVVRCNIYNDKEELISTCDCTYYYAN